MTQDDNIRNEAFHQWEQKDDLIKGLAVGFTGPPEIKKSEKQHFLGEFKERVLKALTKDQVRQKGIYAEIKEALKNPKVDKLIINGELIPHNYKKYIKLAKKFNVKTMINHDPDLVGEIGLVVISNDAVDEENIFIESKKINIKQNNRFKNNFHGLGREIKDTSQLNNSNSSSIIARFKNFILLNISKIKNKF